MSDKDHFHFPNLKPYGGYEDFVLGGGYENFCLVLDAGAGRQFRHGELKFPSDW